MPNIDRDDENATRYEMPKPTIDEQINSDIGLLRVEAAKYPHDDYRRNQLNGVANRLKRIIEATEVPEPVILVHETYAAETREVEQHDVVLKADYDSLLAAYRRALAERDDALKALDDNWVMHQRVVTAERQLAKQKAINEQLAKRIAAQEPNSDFMTELTITRRQLAELQAKHDALVKRMRPVIGKAVSLFADGHTGECAFALEQGEMKCECGSDRVITELLEIAGTDDIDAMVAEYAAMSAVALRREGE